MKYLKKYESNLTIEGDSDLLDFHFGLEAQDIKDWCQDYLDDHNYDFKFVVKVLRGDLKFRICFISNDDNSKSSVQKLTNNITSHDFVKLINFLKQRLSPYNLTIDREYRVFLDFESQNICNLNNRTGILIKLKLLPKKDKK